MSKIGVSLKIDVTKLDKSRFHKGEKGTYCDLTVFIDPDNPDQYDQHGGIQEARKKDEPKDKKMPYVGNCKVFWQEGGGAVQNQQQAKQDDDGWGDIDAPF